MKKSKIIEADKKKIIKLATIPCPRCKTVMSQVDIAKKFGVGRSWINKILKEAESD